jgi:transposase
MIRFNDSTGGYLMRGPDIQQVAMFSYLTLERRIPADHPLRSIRRLTDRALARISGELDKLYSSTGRESIPPERLLRALLLMVLYSVRSERQRMEQLNYNLLFRWFVGLEMDDEVWDVTVFTKNRERLIAGEVSQRLLAAVLVEGRDKQLLSAEHFTVDGTLIPAWAASRSFQEKSDPPAPGQGSGHGGEVLLRDEVESKTDPEARLFKKGTGDKSVPSYLGPTLMENRNGLGVAAQASCAGTAAERAAALEMLDKVVGPKDQRAPAAEITLGADTQYQDRKFIGALGERAVAPHISEYMKGANVCKNALQESERADPRRSISQRKRRLIERVFGWAKLDRPLQQIKLRGLARVDWFYRLVVTAYNLMRMGKLIPMPTQVG